MASETPFKFEIVKKTEPIYIVNDSTIITAEQFNAIDPAHIESIEVRRAANSLGDLSKNAEGRSVVLIHLADHRSFLTEFLRQKKNHVKN